MNTIKNKWKYPTVIILLLTFLGLMISVILEHELHIDSYVFDKIILVNRNDGMTNILKLVTVLANPKVLIVFSIVIFILLKGKKEKFYFTFNICFITLLNQTLKRIIVRPRPSIEHLIKQGGYSFPSGHSMASVAFYGYLIYLLWKTKWNKVIKYIGTALLILLIITICFSRIYLGVHYVSDVIAGICLSLIHLIVLISIINKREN